ncbi:MAG: DNA polymerase I [Ruminococcaceae bacterium]|nr:DNA polymerase I [Oscillospiraceae bacterium]
MKLLAIDGNSIINRAFYGIKLLTTKDGQYTNGIYGFINILHRLEELENPDGVAVAFDLKVPTFRHEMYPEYKAGRKGMPEELRSQMPILKEWLALAGYTCIECAGFEADDILGTLSALCEQNGDECIISTGDRDSLQLISEKTRVLLAATKMGKPEIINFTKDALFEKYGLTPNEMIELKALMGDSSDNIPGVAGVGEKTANDLVSRFHNIDYIYQNIETIDLKDSVRNKLIMGKESAFLSRKLGTICKTAPINQNLDDYKIKPQNTNELARLMTRLEFFKLMEKMNLKPEIAHNDSALQNKRVITVLDNPQFCESATVYFENGQYAVVSGDSVFKCDSNTVKQLFENQKISKKVYDYKTICKQFEYIINVTFDALLAGYICNPSASSYAPDRLFAEYDAVLPEIKGESNPLLQNACLFDDVCNKLNDQLQKSGQLDLFKDIELPLAKVLASMEQKGFKVDLLGLQNMSKELEERISKIQSEIYSLVGYEFNLNSPKQLGVALFEELGLPAKKKTKSGYSTNAEVLKELKNVHPAVSLLLEYRKLAKLKSTYTDGLQGCVAPDGRIHTTFNQTEARTGRISSLEPNLQNIPVRTEEGKRLREFFVAEDGYVLVDADYSQIELRVLASMANDSNMISAFESGADIHTATASQVFSMPIDMVTPLMRSRAKAVNFGIVYGIGAFSLSKDIGVTRKEADNYIKSYLATYPSVAKYMENTIADAKQNGYVTTLFGRRRPLPELSSSNGMIRSFGERVARNAPIQGTAADIIKLAMIKVFERLEREVPTAHLILQVHDELIVECKSEDAQKVSQILQTEMQNAANLKVTLTADANYGKNWLESKG